MHRHISGLHDICNLKYICIYTHKHVKVFLILLCQLWGLVICSLFVTCRVWVSVHNKQDTCLQGGNGCYKIRKIKTRAALNAEIPSATKISIWHNMVILWYSHTVKQSRQWFCLIEIKHYSSRGSITLWLCVLHVHWRRECETVPEQHWNKQGTVSESQCTPP